MSALSFAGKTAVVSGGATGVGAAATRKFALAGAAVALVDVNEPAALALVDEIRRAGGGPARFIKADLRHVEEIETAVAAIAAMWPRVDILFNHAGGLVVKPFLETTAQDWDDLLRLNVTSMALMSRGIIPLMLERGGSIVITSSISGLTASPFEGAYCVTKAACLQLARAIAVEFRDRGIRANAVCPGFVRTPHGLHELDRLAALGAPLTEDALHALQGRICEPDEVADVVLFLASDLARFVSGENIAVDNAALAAT